MNNEPTSETPKQIAKKTGAYLKTIRQVKRRSIKQLAAASGLASSYLYDIESQRTAPSLESLIRYARGLGLYAHIVITDSPAGPIIAKGQEAELLTALREGNDRAALTALVTALAATVTSSRTESKNEENQN